MMGIGLSLQIHNPQHLFVVIDFSGCRTSRTTFLVSTRKHCTTRNHGHGAHAFEKNLLSHQRTCQILQVVTRLNVRRGSSTSSKAVRAFAHGGPRVRDGCKKVREKTFRTTITGTTTTTTTTTTAATTTRTTTTSSSATATATQTAAATTTTAAATVTATSAAATATFCHAPLYASIQKSAVGLPEWWAALWGGRIGAVHYGPAAAGALLASCKSCMGPSPNSAASGSSRSVAA